MPRPFKPYITGFEDYEDKIQRQVAKYYGTIYPLPEDVKYIDKNIVRDEAAALYGHPPDWISFYDSVCPMDRIIGHTPWRAMALWMKEFRRLTQCLE
jgi:hypothetical protein